MTKQKFEIYDLEKEVVECFKCKSHSLIHNSGVVLCVDCAEMRFLDGTELDSGTRETMLSSTFLPKLITLVSKIEDVR